MSGQIEVSPGGVGYIRTTATRDSGGEAQTIWVRRRPWAARSSEKTVVRVRPGESNKFISKPK